MAEEHILQNDFWRNWGLKLLYSFSLRFRPDKNIKFAAIELHVMKIIISNYATSNQGEERLIVKKTS